MAERDDDRTHRSDAPEHPPPDKGSDDAEPATTGEPPAGPEDAADAEDAEPGRAGPTAGPEDHDEIEPSTGAAADTSEQPDSDDAEPATTGEPPAGPEDAADAGVGTAGPGKAGSHAAEDHGDGGGGGTGRRGAAWWAYAAGAVAVAIVLYGIVAAVGGTSESDSDTGGGDRSAQPDGDSTTAPASPPEDEEEEDEEERRPPGEAELVSELAPEAGDDWTPAGDDVTLGGTAHQDTIVSGPVGPCDGGVTRSVTYDLAGAYTRLDGAVGLVDDDDAGPAVEITVELDGERAWWKSFATGEAGRVQVDVTAARELTITAAAIDPGTSAADVCARAGFADLRLT